jgi:hypothetical protein
LQITEKILMFFPGMPNISHSRNGKTGSGSSPAARQGMPDSRFFNVYSIQLKVKPFIFIPKGRKQGEQHGDRHQ